MTLRPAGDDAGELGDESVRPHGDVVIAGLGNEYRHDDGVGVLVSRRATQATRVRDVGPAVDPLDLLGRWDHARLAVVVDAVRTGADPGTVRVLDLGALRPAGGDDGHGGAPHRHDPRHVRARATSSHGVDVVGVLRLARAVGSAPDRVLLVGIEGQDFSPGVGLSPRVSKAVPAAVDQIVSLLQEVRPCA